MARNRKVANVNLRYNILTVIIYIVGIILIVKLFSLQIIHGAEYREQSNTRLTRESVLEASRGAILDKTGTSLVTSKMEFSLEMYKSKVDNDTLNQDILNMIEVLEKYEISYVDSFPGTAFPGVESESNPAYCFPILPFTSAVSPGLIVIFSNSDV